MKVTLMRSLAILQHMIRRTYGWSRRLLLVDTSASPVNKCSEKSMRTNSWNLQTVY